MNSFKGGTEERLLQPIFLKIHLDILLNPNHDFKSASKHSEETKTNIGTPFPGSKPKDCFRI